MPRDLRETRHYKSGRGHQGPRYRLAKDVVIPAGTEVGVAAHRTILFTNHVEADLAHGPDSTSTWRMDTDEAIAAGLIEEVK